MESKCKMKSYLLNEGEYKYKFYNCSNCNESYGYTKSFDETIFKYCPNCGKKIVEWID